MKVRSKADLRSALLRTLVLGVLFGLTFLQLEKRQSALFTINGCLFFTMMMGVMNICMSAAMGIPTRLPTLIREHRNGAYGVPAMYLSKALADAPFDFLIALLWSSLMYWMVGFRDDFGHYLYFFVVVYALTIVATGVGYLGGYTAPVAAIGMLVVLLNIMPQMLFGGLFMNLNSVPPGFIWLKTISIFRLGFEALMINQWQDYGVLDCSNEPVCVAADGEAVLSHNGIDPAASYAGAILWLLIPLCVYHSLAFLILWRRAQPRQFEGAAPEDDTKGELRVRGAAETLQHRAAGDPATVVQPVCGSLAGRCERNQQAGEDFRGQCWQCGAWGAVSHHGSLRQWKVHPLEIAGGHRGAATVPRFGCYDQWQNLLRGGA